MPGLRFNHMEITVPKGWLDGHRDEIRTFYGELFGFDSLDVPILGQLGLLLRTDPETSQFLLVTEQSKHLTVPGYDHLGFLHETRAEVDALLEECKKRRALDPRIEIKEYDDLVVGPANELAVSVVRRIADRSTEAYSPVFVHGGCGIGKTQGEWT